MTGNFDYKAVILFVLIGVLILFALLGTLLNDPKKRESAGAAAWAAFALFLLAGFAVSLSGIQREPNMTTDELILLAKSAETQGAIDRAIELNEQLMMQVPEPANKAFQEKIDALRKRQVSLR